MYNIMNVLNFIPNLKCNPTRFTESFAFNREKIPNENETPLFSPSFSDENRFLHKENTNFVRFRVFLLLTGYTPKINVVTLVV